MLPPFSGETRSLSRLSGKKSVWRNTGVPFEGFGQEFVVLIVGHAATTGRYDHFARKRKFHQLMFVVERAHGLSGSFGERLKDGSKTF